MKDVSIILQQELKYHGVYKPPRPRAGGVKAKKGKKAKKTIRARAKVVPKQQGDIKKTKVNKYFIKVNKPQSHK